MKYIPTRLWLCPKCRREQAGHWGKCRDCGTDFMRCRKAKRVIECPHNYRRQFVSHVRAYLHFKRYGRAVAFSAETPWTI